MDIPSPAQAVYWLGFTSIPGRVLFPIVYLLGLACFVWIVWKRLAPMLRAERDFRFDRPLERLGMVLRYWFGQWRHPRYRLAGTIHILIFAGFLILFVRAFALLLMGISNALVMP